MKYTIEMLARIYISQIVQLHKVLISIVCDGGSLFTSHLWRALQHCFSTWLEMSTTFHPETHGKSEQSIQVLEGMLRVCVIDLGACWDYQFPLVEFAYNNCYHSSIQMDPFEELYGRQCRYVIGLFDSLEMDSLNTNFLRDAMEQVHMIHGRMLTTRS